MCQPTPLYTKRRIPHRLMAVMLALVAGLTSGILRAENITLFTEDLPPYSMEVDGRITGVTVDIVAELFRRSGYAFEVRMVPWQRAYLMARTEPASCAFPVQRSQENEALFHWVSPIVISRSAFYTLKDSPLRIRVLDDVRSVRIGTYRGSGVADYLVNQGFTLDLTTHDSQNLKKLALGRLDVWAADTLTANYLTRQLDLGPLQEQLVYFTVLRALACNLDTRAATIDSLNHTLRSMYADGAIDRIVEAYR